MTEIYRGWVVGKMCQPTDLAISSEPMRVIDVEFAGPPSAVYGFANVTYENGKIDHVVGRGHKPTKADFKIVESKKD